MVEKENVISFDLHEIDNNECIIDRESGYFVCKRGDLIVSGQMKEETVSDVESIKEFFRKYNVGNDVKITFR